MEDFRERTRRLLMRKTEEEGELKMKGEDECSTQKHKS